MDAIMMDSNRTLVITAHPDDLELWCGATVATFVEKGACVQPVIVAQEREGQFFESGEREGVVRRAEAEKSAAILGVENPIFLANYIQQLDLSELAGQIEKVVDSFSPEQILTHYPLDEHFDHAFVGMAVYSVFIQAEGLIPLYFFITPAAYSYTVSQVIRGDAKTKRKALIQHTSQGFNELDTGDVEPTEAYVAAHLPWLPGR